MTSQNEATQQEGGEGRGLAAAIRRIKNAEADRGDVVVELREGQLSRLDILAERLRPVFEEVPRDDDRFDFAISSGNQPRLWIDAVAHVAMARDRRTYRFLRDTRLGRVVLAESADPEPVAERVTAYVAERIVERERELAGSLVPLRDEASATGTADATSRAGTGRFGRSLGVLVLGALFGALLTLIFGWQRLAELGIPF